MDAEKLKEANEEQVKRVDGFLLMSKKGLTPEQARLLRDVIDGKTKEIRFRDLADIEEFFRTRTEHKEQ